jgi:hypothetical protein
VAQLRAVAVEDRAAVLDELRARLANRSVAHGPVAQGSAGATVRAASTPAVDPTQVLPVLPALVGLLPDGGLRRGSVVSVLGPDAAAPGPSGATSLLLALLAAASAAGSWAAVVGVGDLGVLAAAELGVDLSRLALVPTPGPNLTGTTAALLDGVDLVAVAGIERLSAAERTRLAARSRQHGSVLLPLGPWPGAEVTLRCSAARWSGLGAAGGVVSRGRLRERELLVSVGGRGRAGGGWAGAAQPVLLRLPGAAGRVESCAESSPGSRSASARESAGSFGQLLAERAG